MKRILNSKETETKEGNITNHVTSDVTNHVTSDVYYECGSCKGLTNLEDQDSIRCKQCGYRILYKQRSDIPSEYVAR